MRRASTLLVTLLMALSMFSPAAAGPAAFPDSIGLPDGFFPEGIAVGAGRQFYVSSLLDGAVYAGDLRTGEGDGLVPGVPDRYVAGMQVDRRSGLLWGAGADAPFSGTGDVYAFDTRTGATVVQVSVPGAVFLNDLAVTRDAVYVTDSLAPVLWKVPLDQRGSPSGPAVALPLAGEFTFLGSGPGEFVPNLNGIDATPDGGTLVTAHTTLGVLYRVDPATGETTEIALDAPVPSGDGVVLHGTTVWVVQNFLNQIAVVDLAPDLRSGVVAETITSPTFRVPATAARFGDRLYAVNARFDDAFPPLFGVPPVTIDYEVVLVP